MALRLPIPFPILAPILNPTPTPTPNPIHHGPPTELRFSRWNNANAESFNQRQRAQQEIEDDIRRERRFDSATRIAANYDSATPTSTAAVNGGDAFKSIGTPSFPSSPSIPGKKSKYSKNPYPKPNPNSHPAFRRIPKTGMRISNSSKEKGASIDRKADVRIDEGGMSYVIDGAPFEFKYSYTETPKVKPVKLREAPYAPFGPTTMPRPWTGRAPLPPSKKKLREFDSFKLPPPHKKGVKPVQAPGPFLPGSGPKYVMSREEILGEPLTNEEIKDLVNGCLRSKRQLNMGRDGLTHNMLDNIHAHWKRRRVCKIKCKGVCTVDMDNVRQQLEERTGGKIIYSTGGVLYLFRGRNYNYRTRPRFPLMLWKPVTPVYPRLVQQVPEGLTLEEATEMRKTGHKLMPIRKLGKNGVYSDLVKNVREAFEECELVRINCQGMNGSDYRKIAAKLKDLVPCVLLSFAHEHILMWRGKNWKSSLTKLENDLGEAKVSGVETATSLAPPVEGQEVSTDTGLVNDASSELLKVGKVMGTEGNEGSSSVEYINPCSSTHDILTKVKTLENENRLDIQSPVDYGAGTAKIILDNSGHVGVDTAIMPCTFKAETRLDDTGYTDGLSTTVSESDTVIPDVGSTRMKLDSVEADPIANEEQEVSSESFQDVSEPARLNVPCTEGILSLLQQAVEGGLAMVLGDSGLDADVIYQKTVVFSQSAPPGPVFRYQPRKVRFKKTQVQEIEEQETGNMEPKEITTVLMKEGSEKKGVLMKEGSEKRGSKTRRKKDFSEHLDNVVPQGSLRVDELAKLLA